MKAVRFLEEALEEFLDQVAYYEDREIGLGERRIGDDQRQRRGRHQDNPARRLLMQKGAERRPHGAERRGGFALGHRATLSPRRTKTSGIGPRRPRADPAPTPHGRKYA